MRGVDERACFPFVVGANEYCARTPAVEKQKGNLTCRTCTYKLRVSLLDIPGSPGLKATHCNGWLFALLRSLSFLLLVRALLVGHQG